MTNRFILGTAIAGLLAALAGTVSAAALGNGFKIGEVTPTSAIVWTRVTASAEPNLDGVTWAKDAEAVPPGLQLADMHYSLPGADGEVRVGYAPSDGSGSMRWTAWTPVRTQRDSTAQFLLDELTPACRYTIEVEARPEAGAAVSARVTGGFATAPASEADVPVSFTVVTCHDFERRDDPENGHRIYPAMARAKPDFMVHAGDVEYYDKPRPYAKNAALARYKWNRLFALPYLKDFYRTNATYFMKDDHDIVMNDASPGVSYGDLTWDEGLAIFHEQTPTGEKPYRTLRWGRHLQVWLVEGREYRSPNDAPDGPDKTIWGAEQKRWFFETFAASDATFRILITPTPILGPDRSRKNDNHANAGFTHEGDEIRAFLAAQEDAFVITGDRHWQYATVSSEYGIREYGCGAGSDAHAGGWRESMRTPEQTFLRIAGGFLRVEIETAESGPRARLQHCDVDGNVVNEEILEPRRPGAGPTAATSSAKGWTVLFDGETDAFERFHLYNLPGAAPERWRVLGKVLSLASREEAPGRREKEDLVVTPRGYTDFELEVDWKASPGANGGIFYRVVEDPAHDKPWHTGLEYQLLDDENHPEGKIDTHRAGDLFDLISGARGLVRPALAWNHSRIVVRGTRIEHWLNGQRVLQADTASPEWRALIGASKYRDLVSFARPVPGHVILQDHGDRLWFKSIRIREL